MLRHGSQPWGVSQPARRSPWLALLALLSIATPAAGANGPTIPRLLNEVETVRLVLLPTTVTTGRGKPVRSLAREDFLLSEDGVSQEIRVFATEEETPISLVFLLDVSASMGLQGRLDEAKIAIASFVGALGPDDRFGLICFADEQVTWVTDLTSDREVFLNRLAVQSAGGRTALFDAIAASPRLVDERTRGRKAIVLITDGFDNASKVPVLRAVWLARRVNVPIYTLSFVPIDPSMLPRRIRDSLAILERFSDETGGTQHTIHDSGDLRRAISKVLRELRLQYVIGYYPDHGNWDGTFRRIQLTTAHPGLRVRTRRGYYAEP